MSLSTHVLDVAAGHPAEGIAVRAELFDSGWRTVGTATTDADGRVPVLVADEDWHPGRWRITFDLLSYLGEDAFFPAATVEFIIHETGRLHIPLLLSPFGYTTYRGS
ncbi:MAG TPA: hydroxyisourate hydrolase [Frankiaceae bacterium]|nr:hydroxyisourate hydrolase [Frankiaceae bacterium]